MRRTKVLSIREAQRQLDQLAARIQQSATPLPAEGKAERVAKGEQDFWFFGRTYFPHYMTAAPAMMHREIVPLMLLLLVLIVRMPRGFAKTTIGQIFIAWCALYKKRHFAVWIGKSDEAAQESVTAIVLEFEMNERIIRDFGEQRTKDWSAPSGFRLKNGFWLLALGRGGVIRGRKKQQYRPDLVIADDLEDDELVRNPKRVRQLLKWWLQSVLPMLAREGTAVWLGTSLSQKSALDQLLDPEWSYEEGQPPPECMRKSYPAENLEGESVWPEVWPTEMLRAKRAQIGSTAYNQEFLHRAEMAGGMFRREWFKPYKDTPPGISPINGGEAYLPVEGLITVQVTDPSVKSKETNDYKAVIVVSKHLPTQCYYIRHAWIRHDSAMNMLKKMFALHILLKPYLWLFEAIGFALLYKDLINKIWHEFGIRPPIKFIDQQGLPKEIRIRRLEPIAEAGRIYYMPGHSDQNVLIEQLCYYPSSGMADDGPDALDMAIAHLEPMRAQVKARAAERIERKDDSFVGAL